jgi:putative ABC transport system ATP-binding protein
MFLRSRNLSYKYTNSEKILSFPDIELKEGETLLVLGNSGSGKTTFIHLLSLLLPLQKGDLTILNKNIRNETNKSLHDFRAKNISLIHQKPYFVRSLNGIDNLKLGPYFQQKKLDLKALKHFAEKLGIYQLLTKKPDELSGGEQQRLSILRAIISKPKLIFADEPTSNLDDKNCKHVFNSLQELSNESNAALVIVTHDTRLKALVSNQIVLNNVV